MNKRSCFVISPIGTPDSEERECADRFLELIKEISELHNLETVRADEVSGTSDINNDVIERVLNSDLCIIDLSGLNPNVMYEFGIRYQTGLPYIICARQGTTLPFDVISRRTIFYGDLDNVKELREAKAAIRRFIQAFENTDYQSPTLISNTEIYQLLKTVAERIERMDKFENQLSSPYFSTSITALPFDNDADELLSQLKPSEAFQYAYTTKQIKLAEAVLEYCRNEPPEFFINKLCALATLGSEKASNEIRGYLDKIESIESFKELLEMIGSLVTCYVVQDTETQHFGIMNAYFDKALGLVSSNKERAAILNQKERLYAGGKEYRTAKQIAEEVLRLNDEESAYYYNYATILHHLNDPKAIDYAKKSVDISDEDDDDHLAFLCSLLKESDNPADLELLNTYLHRLERASPLKAKMIRLKAP